LKTKMSSYNNITRISGKKSAVMIGSELGNQ
jgi:hypothetical protein